MGSESLPKMEYRFLGRSGLQVSVISLGGWLTYGGHVENGSLCFQISNFQLHLTATIEASFACMKAAYDAGINFFDCAEGYAGGQSEITMGEAIKKFG
jgi:aryl-alcohol dehydrogenase-like predicted oxidoreductase